MDGPFPIDALPEAEPESGADHPRVAAVEPAGSRTPGWAWALIGLAVLLLAGQVVLGLLIQQRSASIDTAVAGESARLDGIDARITRLGDVVGQLGLQLEEREAVTAASGSSQAPIVSSQQTTGLPPIPQGGADPAVGMTLGSFTAPDWRTGADHTVEASDQARIILVWAHWCPYCQQELPIITELLEAGSLDGFPDVEFLSITTFIDPSRPNPLEPYLTENQFDFPVLVDADGSLAAALGIQAVPAWVVIDDTGVVLGRFTGAIPAEQVLGVFGEVQRIQTEG